MAEIIPGLFEVTYTNEPRQRPALIPRDPLVQSLPGDMVDRLPTGFSPILTDGLDEFGLLEKLDLPGYNRPGSKVTPQDELPD